MRDGTTQIVLSLLSIAAGFEWLVSGGGDKCWAQLSVRLSFLWLFTFAVWVSYISFLAAKDEEESYFIPYMYRPSKTEVRYP